MNQPIASTSRLQYFPVSLFGAIMGYAGLSLVFQNATAILGVSAFYYQVLSILTVIFFTFIGAAYLVKLMKFLPAVQQELQHPIASNFFSAISISLMLIAVIFVGEGVQSAEWLWLLGAGLQLLLTLFTLNSWVHHEHWQIQEMTPAWFIPVVGNMVAPLGAIHFASIETAWFFFSIGLFFWLILQTIVMYRLFFHPPMIKLLEPLLFIFIAPPAVGFLSYFAINGGEVDTFARFLYYIGLFFSLLLLTQAFKFIKVPFSLSWWAFTFPIAAMANASLIMYQQLGYFLFGLIALCLVLVIFFVVLSLTLKTFRAIANKQLCLPPITQTDSK